MKYEAIRAYSQEFSVRKMCKVMRLADTAYYQWLRRKEGREKKKEAEKALIERIQDVFEKAQHVYGYRRMQRAMVREGIMPVNIRFAGSCGKTGCIR
jgi:hypothetical protein